MPGAPTLRSGPPCPAFSAEARRGVASCSYKLAVSPRHTRSRGPSPQLLHPTRRRRCSSLRAAATAAADVAAASVASYDALVQWCIEQHSLPPTALDPALIDGQMGEGEVPGFVTNRSVAQGEVLLQIPGDLGVTTVDVEKEPSLAALAQGRSELVGLALWLLRERSMSTTSEWAPLLATLPEATETPVLWDEDQRTQLLRGSPVLQEARARQAALQEEWAAIAALTAATPGLYPPSVYNESAFLAAISVVLAHAAFLPSAQCFALLPIVGGLPRTGSAGGAQLDYDLELQAVTLVAAQPYQAGQEVRLYDGRPSGELLLATGTFEKANPADCLTMPVSLVAADRMYTMKKQVLEELGFGPREEFPIYEDRIAVQQLAYMRLSRLQDPAQLAMVTFENDVVITVELEYEVLQLMMGDLRERLQAYSGEYEEDVKDLQRRDLSTRERMAAALRLAEKRILRGTMDGVRRRLAPIRGIPAKKGGMQDPNADFKEIFDTIEAIPSAPKRLLDGLRSWATGESDPTWKKK